MRDRRPTISRGWAGRTVRHVMPVLALTCLGMLLGAGGCSNQQEGERCTFFNGGDAGENGTDECASGLLCTVTSYYTIDMTMSGGGMLGVCCPPSGTAATAAACQPTVGGSTTGGPPVGDGGFDGTLGDSAGGAGADGTTDAAPRGGLRFVLPPSALVEVAEQALVLTVALSLPIVGVAAVVGLFVAAFQAASQVQDATLAHLPRLVAVVGALVVLGPWMGTQVATFAERLFLLVR